MAITRTIYTQGAVVFSQTTANEIWSGTVDSLTMEGVQSASFSASEAKTDVNVFGERGAVKRVQLEPSAANMEVSLVLTTGWISDGLTSGAGGYQVGFLRGLMDDSLSDTPKGCTIEASGVGKLEKAILSSCNLEASVGGLPTMSLSFEGVSGAFPVSETAPSAVTALTLDVATPDNFGAVYWKTAQPSDAEAFCPQSITAAWEVGTERVNCLGNPVNSGQVFSTPPGTLTFTAEGVKEVIAQNGQTNFVTGVEIGGFFMGDVSTEFTSLSANMAVGEATSTYTVESAGTALGSDSFDVEALNPA